MAEREHPIEVIKKRKAFDEEFGEWFARNNDKASREEVEEYVKKVREKIDTRMQDVADGWDIGG